MLRLASVRRSPRAGKKYVATFVSSDGTRAVHFGAAGYADFTQHCRGDAVRAKQRRAAYIARHRARENWRDPTTAGALSRYILWEKPTVRQGVAAFRRRFGV